MDSRRAQQPLVRVSASVDEACYDEVMHDYRYLAALDAPGVHLFFPFPRFHPARHGALDYHFEVEPGVSVHCRLHRAPVDGPTILVFHGNAEVVSDYDSIVPEYAAAGISLFVADYRGFGASTGEPKFTSMLSDAHLILAEVKATLAELGMTGPLFVFGRSMGSASAVLLAADHPADVAGLIVESGFDDVSAFSILGFEMPLDFPAERPNLSPMRRVRKPTVVIHGAADDILTLDRAERLVAAAEHTVPRLVVIPWAGHNDILYRGDDAYLSAIFDLVYPSGTPR